MSIKPGKGYFDAAAIIVGVACLGWFFIWVLGSVAVEMYRSYPWEWMR